MVQFQHFGSCQLQGMPERSDEFRAEPRTYPFRKLQLNQISNVNRGQA